MPSQSSILKNQQSKPEPVMKNTFGLQFNPIDGPGKAQQYNYEDGEGPNGPQSITTPICVHLTKDCEDFEGPILANVTANLSPLYTQKQLQKLIGLENGPIAKLNLIGP
ncbi:hypothetical protein Tco_0294215 [Tanacetum coccineum]